MKKQRFISLLLAGLLILPSVFIFSGCGKEYESEKFTTIKWPDSKLAQLLPTPESTVGAIELETDDSLTVLIGNTTDEQYNQYLDACKEKGFTKDKYQTSGTDENPHYSAENKDGYSLTLEYYKDDDSEGYKNTMSIDLNAPSDDSEDKNSSDSKKSSSKKAKKTTSKSKSKSSSKSSESGKVSSKFKATMDSYEEFFDEYISFMKKYNDNPSDLSLLNEYSDYMSKYSDYMDKLNDIDEDELSAADAAYYLKVQARITKKLSEVE